MTPRTLKTLIHRVAYLTLDELLDVPAQSVSVT